MSLRAQPAPAIRPIVTSLIDVACSTSKVLSKLTFETRGNVQGGVKTLAGTVLHVQECTKAALGLVDDYRVKRFHLTHLVKTPTINGSVMTFYEPRLGDVDLTDEHDGEREFFIYRHKIQRVGVDQFFVSTNKEDVLSLSAKEFAIGHRR